MSHKRIMCLGWVTAVMVLFAALANAVTANSDGQPSEPLAKFLYELPIMPGMERDRYPGETRVQNRSEHGNDDALQVVILRAKEGQTIPAESILAFYNEALVDGKGFRAWHKGNDALHGTFMAPSRVTKGDAYVSSNGSIRFWLPAEGNFITFQIYQRRYFDFSATTALLDNIEAAFTTATQQAGYQIEARKLNVVSDRREHTLNECFVGQRDVSVIFKEKSHSCFDNNYYLFYLSVFPTQAHAEQWRERIAKENRNKARSWLNSFTFEPRTIGNVVVEYRYTISSPKDEAFAAALAEELAKLRIDPD